MGCYWPGLEFCVFKDVFSETVRCDWAWAVKTQKTYFSKNMNPLELMISWPQQLSQHSKVSIIPLIFVSIQQLFAVAE